MCSRKCDTPFTSAVSSRAPVFTNSPSAPECESGLVSATTSSPLGGWRGLKAGGILHNLLQSATVWRGHVLMPVSFLMRPALPRVEPIRRKRGANEHGRDYMPMPLLIHL